MGGGGALGGTEARLDLVRRTRVEQAIDRERFGQFSREVLRARTLAGRTLAVLRRYRDDVERRGVVVLVHGFAQNPYTWHIGSRNFVDFLADDGLDVFCLDLAGYGSSAEHGFSLSFAEHVDDTAAVVRSIVAWAGGRERAFVVGHCLGGTVSYAAAARMSEHVAGLVTLASPFRCSSNPLARRAAQAAERMGLLEPAARRLGGVRTRHYRDTQGESWEQALDLDTPARPVRREPRFPRERFARGFDWTVLGILLTTMRWAAEGHFSGELWDAHEAAFCALDLRLLVIAADRDRIVAPAEARTPYDLSRSTDRTFKVFSPSREEVHWGHTDVVLGEKAPLWAWPYVRDWLLARCPAEAPGGGSGAREG